MNEFIDKELQNKMNCKTSLRCVDCRYYSFKPNGNECGLVKNFDEFCTNPKFGIENFNESISKF